MVLEEYLIRISSAKLSDEITFIKSNFSHQSCGWLNGRTIKARLDLDAEQKEAFIEAIVDRGASKLSIAGVEIELYPYQKGGQIDLPIYNTELSITKNNVGSAYTDLFTNYGGRSFFADTRGYKKLMYQIYLNLNGSTGTQSLRVVNHADDTQVLFEVIVANGQNQDTGVIIPEIFKTFRGRLRIQVKSTIPNDDPIYDGIRILLRRR